MCKKSQEWMQDRAKSPQIKINCRERDRQREKENKSFVFLSNEFGGKGGEANLCDGEEGGGGGGRSFTLFSPLSLLMTTVNFRFARIFFFDSRVIKTGDARRESFLNSAPSRFAHNP